MSRNESDVEARVRELEATVRGLTQELVDANERIRALEAAAAEEPDEEPAVGPGTVVQGVADAEESTPEESSSGDGAARQMEEQGEEEPEAEDHELDDIIVA